MWWSISKEEVAKKMCTDISYGLSENEAQKRIIKFGQNKFKEQKKENIFIKFINQMNDSMIIILIIAAGISALVSYFDGTNNYIDSIIIVFIVVMNAIFGVVQESKAEKALEALKKLSEPIVTVKRESKIKKISIENLVPGDYIYVERGGIVPADARLIKTSNLQVEEAALTGETVPIEKNENIKIDKECSIGDMKNMIFATTIVVGGHAEAIVTETAMNTKVGKIAQLITNVESKETPLQRKLDEIGKKLGLIILFICLFIFLIGIIKKVAPIEMFMNSVSLAVAAIPEGLTAIVTIILSIGVTKMAKQNAIVRKLNAVETLGSSDIICSDKTGTLTQNKMTVVKIESFDGQLSDCLKKEILENASECSNCNMEKNKVQGTPVEKSIVEAYINTYNKEFKYKEKIVEIPFDSKRKMMTIINKSKEGYKVITKGAPEILMKKCNKILTESGIKDFSDMQIMKSKNEKMARHGLRIIGVAYKEISNIQSIMDSEIENNLIFIGLIGIMDPPRIGVEEAIKQCKEAGIKTIMITGDHKITARTIAEKIGIYNLGDEIITGNEIDELSNEKFEKEIEKYSVFARVSPEHKLKIVNALRKKGHVVAMTGDGVNDAPALKNADIGIAMGKTGTDVAKNASDIVLTDDNFVTIVEAVKNGRHIYQNIRKAIHFLLATNIGEIVAILLGILLGVDMPLIAIQLLWINLVTDSLPAIAIGLEKADTDIMRKKVNKKSIFTDNLWEQIIIEGTLIGILTLFIYSLGKYLYGLEVGRTMAFLVLGFLELFHSLNIRSSESIFKIRNI